MPKDIAENDKSHETQNRVYWERLFDQEAKNCKNNNRWLSISPIKSNMYELLLEAFARILFVVSRIKNRFSKTRPFPRFYIFSLTNEQLENFQKPESFIRFFGNSRFNFSNNESHYLVENPRKKIFGNNSFRETRSIAIHLIIHCASPGELSQISKTFRILKKDLRHKANSSKLSAGSRFKLTLDFAVWSTLMQNRTQTLITTQSHLKITPPAFFRKNHGLQKVMMWYSSNFRNPDQSSSTAKLEDFGDHLNDKIDVHLVWTSEDVAFLRNVGFREVQAVGAIIFQNKALIDGNRNKDNVISYFDVTPYEGMTGIYSPQNAKLTLQNLVTIKSEFEHKENIKIELLVKPKRRYLNNHSAEYLNMLKNYSDNHEVTLLSPQSNLYEIIQGSSLILCYPFTSPALIAKELGIPVKFIFYSKDWVNLPEQMQGIALITNEADLLETLKLTLVK